jgi:hypothetical protein
VVYNGSCHCGQVAFCSACGCAPFGFGTDPEGNAVATVNVRCLPDLELTTLKIVPFDGRSF